MDDARARFERTVASAYEPLQRYIRRRCPADDVDDVLNDTLLALWRRLDDVPEGAEVAWCYGVARRCLANHHRGAQRRLRLVSKARRSTAEPTPRWSDPAEAALHAALAALDGLDREVVRLWAWEQLEPREIAVVLGTTPNAVSVRLGRIRRRLGRDLARQDRPVPGHSSVDGNQERQP